jgi:uncharacterized repeat protein (TIGR03803 family)
MKKNNIVIVALLSLCMGTIKAQYTDLLDFLGSNGDNPFSSLTLSTSGNILYGMSKYGGAPGNGNIFSIHTDGTHYKDLMNFNTTNGAYPEGSLTLSASGSVLYGMTAGGAANYDGLVFSIDTGGSGYNVLLTFNSTNGAYPYGSLTIEGNILFGMTDAGGAYNDGLVFSINTNGTGYKDLLDFNGTNGENPYGTLTLSSYGSKLFGMTYGGGAYNDGLVFSIDTNGTGYRDLLDFNGTNGQNPGYASLTLSVSGSVLFGTTFEGGPDNFGTLFSIDTGGTGYRDLFNFNHTNGEYPQGSLSLSGSLLYGMTQEGGVNYDGNVFSIDTAGTGYSDLFVFSGTNGSNPYGSLTLTAGVLYGMTEEGGIYGDGNIFSLGTVVTGIPTIHNVSSANVYPNPNNGSFAITDISPGQTIELYNYLGQKVYTSSHPPPSGGGVSFASQINISSLSNGIYLIRILNKDGSVASEKKIVKTE